MRMGGSESETVTARNEEKGADRV